MNVVPVFLQSPDFYFYVSEEPCADLLKCPVSFMVKGYLSLTKQGQGVP